MPFAVRTRADDVDKHGADVNALLWHQGKLYSGGDDGKIKVWEEDLTKVTEVVAHSATVYSLAASNDTLYSASNDGTIKAWGLNDLSNKGLVFKDESEIWIVRYSGGHLYSSDNQGLVRVHEGDKILKIFSQMEQLRGLLVRDNLLYGVRDLDLVITEMTGEESNFLIRATLPGRAPLTFAGDKLVFSSRGGKDILVHENSQELGYKQFTEVKDAHEMVINTLIGAKSGNDTLVYSAGWDKVVKQWKVVKDTLTLVNSCDSDIVVNVLAYGEKGEIYAAGSDGHLIRIDV